jgi:hypothetical protein
LSKHFGKKKTALQLKRENMHQYIEVEENSTERLPDWRTHLDPDKCNNGKRH